MASFAKVDSNNIVIQVLSVHDNELMVDGVENEQKGIDFLNNLFKTNDNWKQTSHNNNFRKQFAGIGFSYDAAKEAIMLCTFLFQ